MKANVFQAIHWTILSTIVSTESLHATLVANYSPHFFIWNNTKRNMTRNESSIVLYVQRPLKAFLVSSSTSAVFITKSNHTAVQCVIMLMHWRVICSDVDTPSSKIKLILKLFKRQRVHFIKQYFTLFFWIFFLQFLVKIHLDFLYNFSTSL